MNLRNIFRRTRQLLAVLVAPHVWKRQDVDQARRHDPALPTALLVGFARWKRFMPDFLPGFNVVYLTHNAALSTKLIKQIAQHHRPHVFTWSYKAPLDLRLFCAREGIPLTYVEDGFIRSLGLGADRSAPLSLVFDDRAMHFDRYRPSALEALLESHDFEGDTELAEQGARLADIIVGKGLSKYNFRDARQPLAPLLKAGKRQVLVLGQVEDDLSIRHGAEEVMSGNELVAIAAQENPEAQILYRPHPESLAYAKAHYSNPALVADLCQILGPDYSIADCIEACEKVYTITSLAGFEAALRGKAVVTMGTPFYAGWGFTEDRLPIARRTRKLTPEQVLAGAYIIYPRYAGLLVDATPEQVVDLIEGFAAKLEQR